VHRWAEHTSELELELEAGTPEQVFLDALAAFAELVGDERRAGGERRELEVHGEDRATLLAAWLDELSFLAETEGLVPEQADGLELRDGSLRATLRGHAGEPRQLVKAVTLHRLEFARAGERWRARVVLDV
jgi:SHS2 domain-containing protein